MQIQKIKLNSKSKNKFKNIKENLKIQKSEEVNLSKLLNHTIHTSSSLYRKININTKIFEDIILNEKICVPIRKKNKRYYLKLKDFNKLKNVYEKEKEIYINSIKFNDFCKMISRTYSHIFAHVNENVIELPDKLNNIHTIPLTKIATNNYVLKEDAEKYISTNSQYVSISEFSKELFNINRQIFSKKIKHDDKGNAFFEVNFEEFKHKINLLKNEKSKFYYITRESYEKLKKYIYNKNNVLSNYVIFKDFFKQINVSFKNGFYKLINNNEFRFFYKNKLHLMNVKTICSSYYLQKEEVEKFNNQFSKTTYFPFNEISSIISDIKLLKQLRKKLSTPPRRMNKEIELIYDDLNIKLNPLYYFNSYYFPKNDLQKIYDFMKQVKEKTQNLIHFNSYIYISDKRYRKRKKYLNKEKLLLLDNSKKIYVKLKNINGEIYFNVEDEEKIKKMFN